MEPNTHLHQGHAMHRQLMRSSLLMLSFLSILFAVDQSLASIPLPEHPRPDFQRDAWQNLNGVWRFRFDQDDVGIQQAWYEGQLPFPLEITVPFPWGSKLSGVEDEADIGWYTRSIVVPSDWEGERVFLVVGASDWHTTVWLDGVKLGEHRGGYTPFSMDLTEQVRFGEEQQLVIRVDDTPHKFKLEGKQGYGRAAGIWQTVYLEKRPPVALRTIHFSPDIDQDLVQVDVVLDQPAPREVTFVLQFRPEDRTETTIRKQIPRGLVTISFPVSLENARLWSLDDPYLYEVQAAIEGNGFADRVDTYFGMRKISVGNLPGTEFPYVLLNDKPVYLQLALDQAYHPDGFYTFPSDEFMRDEILRTRHIGLNGQRIHIKVEVPRKLYWADRLGVLIMADVPNSWGPPDADMRRETEYALRGMIARDFNHPSIFSWVNFNETWGLKSDGQKYLPETQEWVDQIYRLTKQLDSTRLVEDNSPCNEDHVATDLNTWHAYLPGYAWRERLDQICRDTHPGSKWNFIGDRTQGGQPMFNSECGNVWGYEGSAGDVDWSWDYHIMMNEFRRHPQICGWLYTEHHDVINEWNGYWRYDRSNKFTGIEQLVEGMSLRDFHSPFYVASERELCRDVKTGQTVQVPLFLSCMTDTNLGGKLYLEMRLAHVDTLGVRHVHPVGTRELEYQPWLNRELEPIQVTMPERPGLAILQLLLKDATGTVLHRNFTTYSVAGDEVPDRNLHVVRFAPDSFRKADWSLKQWNVLDGLKVNGAGSGFFEYVVPWPEHLQLEDVAQVTLRIELSAKQLFGKDRDGAATSGGDFMRGKGTHDPSSNPNAYPMTDEDPFPSAVCVKVMGQSAGIFDLPDDSADHRGILSWHSQKRDRRLREAGSLGYLVDAIIPAAALEEAFASKQLVIRLEVADALPGGLAVYGKHFGRFPLDPTILFLLNN
jgi:hypothetical protein